MKRYYKNVIKSTLLGELILNIKRNHFRRKWFKNNQHNQTFPMSIFSPETVKIGNNTYGELNIVSFDSKTKLSIGNFVSIAENVSFLLDVEHPTNHISTYPFMVKLLSETKCESFSKGDIVVEDDVWIGYGATILSGVRIGQGAIIAAGAIVVKDVPAYSIVGGVPAKIIKYRFTSVIMEALEHMDFNNLSTDKVIANKILLYTPIDETNIEYIMNALKK